MLIEGPSAAVGCVAAAQQVEHSGQDGDVGRADARLDTCRECHLAQVADQAVARDVGAAAQARGDGDVRGGCVDRVIVATAMSDIHRLPVATMTRSNAAAANVAVAAGLRGCTDVTGYGLIGHLREMALAAGVEARIRPPDRPRPARSARPAARRQRTRRQPTDPR